MATSTHLTSPAALGRFSVRPHPFALPLVLWHLLSLDAPSVAALWTWFLARSNHIPLPPSSLIAMFLAVWLLYVSDRLLDARDRSPEALLYPRQLEERHRFHRSHARAFSVGIVLASIALAALLPRLPAPSLRLYAILGALLFAYFVLIHTAAATRSFGLAKELAVGVFFSAATFIPTISSQPGLRLTLLPAAILFAFLCCLNCLFIHTWEHSPDVPGLLPTGLLTVITLVAALPLALFDRGTPRQILVACILSVGLLLLLHRNRHRLSRSTLRAAADLCLLSPFLMLPLVPR